MKLSEIEGFKDQAILLLKFSDQKEYLESLQNGNLYMNNLKYFVELEKKTGIKGMGDALEAANVLNDVHLRFYHHGTDKLAFEATSSTVQMRWNETLYKPVFCLFALSTDMLEVLSQNEDSIEVKLVFGEEQKAKISSKFGKYCLVINQKTILNNLFKAFESKGYLATADFVEYSDFSVNHTDRIESFNKKDAGMLFWKDIDFEYQKEFRIAILNENVDDHLVVEFESIKEQTAIFSTKELLDGQYTMKMQFRQSSNE